MQLGTPLSVLTSVRRGRRRNMSRWARLGHGHFFEHLVGAGEQRGRYRQAQHLAILRLILSSIFVDCWTGISDGFSPLRILPVYTPASRVG